jgi:hypothetical protein
VEAPPPDTTPTTQPVTETTLPPETTPTTGTEQTPEDGG